MAGSSSSESCNYSVLETCSFLSYSSSNGKSQTPKGICPVCLRSGTQFCCSDCVRNGAFMHSRSKGLLERFADKKLRLFQLKEKKANILARYEKLLQKRIRAENLKKDIQLCSEQIHLLKECIKCSNAEVLKTEKMVEHLKEQNKNWLVIKAKYKAKLLFNEATYESSRNSLIFEKAKLNEVKGLVKKCAQRHIAQLMTDIFNISKVRNPKSHLVQSQYTALEEAQQTTYEKGHWQVAGTQDSETFYKIVEAYIPGNGDYSAYLAWTSKCQETCALTPKDTYERNMCYSIGAALMYTAHLVTMLSYYLDVPVPKQLVFSEFGSSELQRDVFLHKVAKLNANIVHLCLMQNVDPLLLKPERAIENLLLLLDPSISDLGRLGPIEPTQRLSDSMENVIIKDLMVVDHEVEPGWDILCEMEDIDNVPIYTHGALTTLPQQASERTLTGDLISSVANIWRAATGQN